MSALRVLVCDDSRTYGTALRRVLEHSGEIEVVGVRTTAEDAIADVELLEPDLVTMDIALPGMSGLEAVAEIMSTRPTPILVLSAYAREGGNTSAAIAAGALEAIDKEELSLREPGGDVAAAFRRRVQVLGRAPVIRHPRARIPFEPRPAESIVGVCASTGGPQALAAVLGALPAWYRPPVLVVQHIAPGFARGLARWLGDSIALPVSLAEDGMVPAPGIVVAPDGADLVVDGSGALSLVDALPGAAYRPSADALFVSLAARLGPAAVAVVLTGMGGDGAAGIEAVRAAGGLTIAQDEATSAVYGMPREAARRGAELILPLDEISGALRGRRVIA